MLKKAQLHWSLEWAFRWMFAIIVIVTFLAITQFYVVKELEVRGAESIVMAERLILSVSEEDEFGNMRIGRIDEKKFAGSLDSTAVFKRPAHLAARLELDGEQLYLQEFFLVRYLPIARRSIEGPQGAREVEWKVLVLDEEAKMLTTTVVTPNE